MNWSAIFSSCSLCCFAAVIGVAPFVGMNALAGCIALLAGAVVSGLLGMILEG